MPDFDLNNIGQHEYSHNTNKSKGTQHQLILIAECPFQWAVVLIDYGEFEHHGGNSFFSLKKVNAKHVGNNCM